MNFNEKLTILRKRKGLSQEEFAYEMGVSRQSVFKWESGDNTPDLEKIKKMSKFFNVSLDRLLDDSLDLGEDAPLEVEEKNAPRSVEPFEMVSPKRDYRALKGIGIALIPGSILLSIISSFIFGGWFRYVAMVALAAGAVFGIALLVFRNAIKDDHLTIDQNHVEGVASHMPFNFPYDEIISAKLYNERFQSVAIQTSNRAADTVIFGVFEAENFVRKINEMVSKEN